MKISLIVVTLVVLVASLAFTAPPEGTPGQALQGCMADIGSTSPAARAYCGSCLAYYVLGAPDVVACACAAARLDGMPPRQMPGCVAYFQNEEPPE